MNLDPREVWQIRYAAKVATAEQVRQNRSHFASPPAEEPRHDALEDLDLEAALGFASHVLTRTSTLWEAATPDQKRRLQTLILPEGVTFNGKALGTPATALIFRLLSPNRTGKAELVDQLRGSWNSLVLWLREVQAWSLAEEVGE